MPSLLALKTKGQNLLAIIEKREFPKPVSEENIEKARIECTTSIALVENIMNRTYAGYWIDRKNFSANELVNEYKTRPAPDANDHPDLKRAYETAK
jgi:hypothetical protein